MSLRFYMPYIYLAISIILFILFVLPDIIKAIRLKKYGIKAKGKLVEVKTLRGSDKYGNKNKSLIIRVKNDDVDFTFECLNTSAYPDLIGNYSVVYIKRGEGKQPLCDIDSWVIMLANAIIISLICFALVFLFFILIYK